MIRRLKQEDEGLYKELAGKFYHSEAVLHPVPEENIQATFDELMRSDVYAECFIIECGGKPAGFALIAKTFSQEAGGLVSWVEELYICEEYRDKGLGSEFLREYERIMPANTRRLRLEIEPDNIRAKRLYERHGFKELPYGQLVKELEAQK